MSQSSTGAGQALDEFGLIARYFAPLGVADAASGLTLGIGDDAAVCEPPAGQSLVVCTDTLVAGRHFPLHTDAYSVGWKAVAVNLSDLAAMGARPAFVLLALSMPSLDPDWLDACAAGMAELCAQQQVRLIGGDTTRSAVLSLTVTALGWVPQGQAIGRAGAQVGDAVVVSGVLGAAAYALRHPHSALQERLDRPQPRTALGQALRGIATAMLDVSDGLAQDLGHVLTASGVGARLELDDLPLPEPLRELSGPERWALAGCGGDDYELCFTVPSARLPYLTNLSAELGLPLTVIGCIEAKAGLRLYQGGQSVDWSQQGFDHFG